MIVHRGIDGNRVSANSCDVTVKDDSFSNFGFEALHEYVHAEEDDFVELFKEFKMQLAGQEVFFSK